MDKFVLITGTSSGIGRTTAVSLSRKGYKILAGVRKEEDFNNLKSEHKNIIPIYLDVLDEKSIEKAYCQIKELNINLFAIINNAGAVVAQPIECINLNDLKYQFELNTLAPVAITQKFMPLITKGKIINISSMASSGIFPYIAPYCASKRAMDILFNSLSIEMKNPDIKIISVKPGSIKTPIWNKSIKNNTAGMENICEEYKTKYEKDLRFLAKNAEKNNYKGMNPEKVSDTIIRILETPNPKSSYCVGFDSKMACLASKLPQDLLNIIIKTQLKKKLS